MACVLLSCNRATLTHFPRFDHDTEFVDDGIKDATCSSLFVTFLGLERARIATCMPGLDITQPQLLRTC